MSMNLETEATRIGNRSDALDLLDTLINKERKDYAIQDKRYTYNILTT
jgi:hypothetical protein